MLPALQLSIELERVPSSFSALEPLKMAWAFWLYCDHVVGGSRFYSELSQSGAVVVFATEAACGVDKPSSRIPPSSASEWLEGLALLEMAIIPLPLCV